MGSRKHSDYGDLDERLVRFLVATGLLGVRAPARSNSVLLRGSKRDTAVTPPIITIPHRSRRHALLSKLLHPPTLIPPAARTPNNEPPRQEALQADHPRHLLSRPTIRHPHHPSQSPQTAPTDTEDRDHWDSTGKSGSRAPQPSAGLITGASHLTHNPRGDRTNT